MKLFQPSDIPAISDALGRSSKRRSELIAWMATAANYLGCQRLPLGRVEEAFEKLHAAGSIMDDLLDNESFRNGEPTYHRRHSARLAALTSSHLAFESIRDFLGLGLSGPRVLDRIMALVHSEEADVGVILKPADYGYLSWYKSVSGRKTAHELMLLLDIFTTDIPLGNTAELGKLYASLETLGLILQMTNDWRDCFEMDPFYRLNSLDDFVLTFSLPVAVFCEVNENGESVYGRLGHAFDIHEANAIVKKFTTPSIRAQCRIEIEQQYNALLAAVESISIPGVSSMSAVAEAAMTGNFWKHYKHVA